MTTKTTTTSRPLRNLRNVGVLAHVDAGKTTLSERFLFYTGRIRRITEVRDKDGGGATMDSRADEQRRGITIKSAATRLDWREHAINLIDTPGHVDFTVEVERSLQVLDGAVLVLCAVAGVQAQTGTVDRQMRRYGVPCVAFINKVDLAGAHPQAVLTQLRASGRASAFVTIPSQAGGVIDVVTQTAVFFDGENGEHIRREPLEGAQSEEARRLRTQLIEAVADVDPALLEQFVDGDTIDSTTLRAAIRRATVAQEFTPVYCGSARANLGVQPLLDGVLSFLPHPGEVENLAHTPQGETVPLHCNNDAPLRALAFKSVEDAYGGLTYLRIYQGEIRRGDTTHFVTTSGRRKLRIGRLVRLHAGTMSELEHATAGDIVAVFGSTLENGVLLTSDAAHLSMRAMTLPTPVVSYAIVPKDKTMLDRFSTVLGRLCREDPSLRLHQDPESGQTLLSGMGELHLEVVCDLLRDDHGIELYRSAPQVTYRETLAAPVRFDHLHRKQDGGNGQYGRVVGELRPSADAFAFEDLVRGGAIPREHIGACARGFESAMARGPLVGAAVTGVTAVLEDGKAHGTDSSDLAFEIASRDAATAAMREAEMRILEPVMCVEAEAPRRFVGAVQSGLLRRRGLIRDVQVLPELARVVAHVPLAEMFGYATDLRSATEGQGHFAMELAEYEAVPAAIQQALIAAHRGDG